MLLGSGATTMGFERVRAYNTFCDLLETHSKFQTVKYEHQKKAAFEKRNKKMKER